METTEKKKTGPKPNPARDKQTHKALLIGDFPVKIRNEAKYAAARQGVTFREFAIAALAEKAGITL